MESNSLPIGSGSGTLTAGTLTMSPTTTDLASTSLTMSHADFIDAVAAAVDSELRKNTASAAMQLGVNNHSTQPQQHTDNHITPPRSSNSGNNVSYAPFSKDESLQSQCGSSTPLIGRNGSIGEAESLVAAAASLLPLMSEENVRHIAAVTAGASAANTASEEAFMPSLALHSNAVANETRARHKNGSVLMTPQGTHSGNLDFLPPGAAAIGENPRGSSIEQAQSPIKPGNNLHHKFYEKNGRNYNGLILPESTGKRLRAESCGAILESGGNFFNGTTIGAALALQQLRRRQAASSIASESEALQHSLNGLLGASGLVTDAAAVGLRGSPCLPHVDELNVYQPPRPRLNSVREAGLRLMFPERRQQRAGTINCGSLRWDVPGSLQAEIGGPQSNVAPLKNDNANFGVEQLETLLMTRGSFSNGVPAPSLSVDYTNEFGSDLLHSPLNGHQHYRNQQTMPLPTKELFTEPSTAAFIENSFPQATPDVYGSLNNYLAHTLDVGPLNVLLDQDFSPYPQCADFDKAGLVNASTRAPNDSMVLNTVGAGELTGSGGSHSNYARETAGIIASVHSDNVETAEAGLLPHHLISRLEHGQLLNDMKPLYTSGMQLNMHNRDCMSQDKSRQSLEELQRLASGRYTMSEDQVRWSPGNGEGDYGNLGAAQPGFCAGGLESVHSNCASAEFMAHRKLSPAMARTTATYTNIPQLQENIAAKNSGATYSTAASESSRGDNNSSPAITPMTRGSIAVTPGFPTSLFATDDKGTPPQDFDKRQLDMNLSEQKSSAGKTMTTVMLRNIPNKYTQRMLLDVVNRKYMGMYDFFYLPIDFRNKCNVGYCFINFTHPQYAEMFKKDFNGLKLSAFKSNKVCQVSWGRVQGLAANIEHYRNSAVMSIPVDHFKPLLFRDGQCIKFPTADGPLPSIKLRPQKC